jgi:hypothetical protein
MARPQWHRAASAAFALAVTAAAAGGAGRPAAAQLIVTSADGATTFKLGTIAQIQAEAMDNANADNRAYNLFFRRVRLEGQLDSGNLSMYFETDSSTLGKGNPDGSKQFANSMVLLDAVVTYSFAKELKLDGGLIRLAPTYTHNQSANSTLALDISPYAYIESAALTTNSGRDYGVQARGYFDDHLEYRLGAFQGYRGKNDVNAFRYSGRLAWYFFGAEEGLFYRGTSLGKVQTLSVGTAFDTQKSYRNYNFDVYYDQPVAGGDGLTFQLDHSWYNGNEFLPSLPKQTTSLAEIGYYLHEAKVLPFFQWTQEKYAADVPLLSQNRYQLGLGYYFQGFNSNLKLAWTRIDTESVKGLNDVVLQYQFYVF